jgi:hypothetical protein
MEARDRKEFVTARQQSEEARVWALKEAAMAPRRSYVYERPLKVRMPKRRLENHP